MITAVIITKNEAKQIKDCIESVLWCDEIIVIDDHSDDDTAKIAKQLGAVVYFHDLNRNFAEQRNFGLEKARHEWVLFLDADERVSSSLKKEIMSTIEARRNRYEGYILKRTDRLWGKKLRYGESGMRKIIRLGRKQSGEWKGAVHEEWMIRGHVSELQEELDHFPHQTIREFLSEINFYTDVRAEELYSKKVTSSFFTILFYPLVKFIQNYLVRRGFLDGIPGLLTSMMMSFHSFLVRSKLWLLWHNR